MALMGKQRNLLDKTYRQQQGAGDPKDGGANGLSQQQGQLKGQAGRCDEGAVGRAKPGGEPPQPRRP